MVHRFGLIGHGAVGSLFARLLCTRGAEVTSYDVLLDDAATADKSRLRMTADGARPRALEQAICESEYIPAITPTQACQDAALRASRYLRPGQVYCDFASTSPAAKRELASIVGGSGALFVEGVILTAVAASPVCPSILLGGSDAKAAEGVLNHYGLRTRFYSSEIGPASAFKMVRGIFAKGMETILIETLLTAQRAGLMNDIWAEIRDILAPDSMERTLEAWIRSHAVSSERRYCEMLEVIRFQNKLDVQPVLTRAAAHVFRRSTDLDIAAAFPDQPERFAEVIEFLDSRLKTERGSRSRSEDLQRIADFSNDVNRPD